VEMDREKYGGHNGDAHESAVSRLSRKVR
jgi:hypothetical protein